MGKAGAFKIVQRETPQERPIGERVRDYNEIYVDFPEKKLRDQGSRCMNCGIPFCNSGCPLGNMIPEWNDLVCKGRFREAYRLLARTNCFPEFTGRICPAPCEESCVLGINDSPVSIRVLEREIVERAFREGWVEPELPPLRTGKKVAVVGSGPSGLGCAMQLNRAGHWVTVFERSDRIGGLLTYGIPNFKLEKEVVNRRVQLMREEGIKFVTNADVGGNVAVAELRTYDAVVLCCGSTKPRDLNVPGRELKGIHYAMEYLTQQNRINLGDALPGGGQISAAGKNVLILGGGDTGADCLGTALRQGARAVWQFELLPEPPKERTAEMPWPLWPMILRNSSAHKESLELQGGKDPGAAQFRDFSISTKCFSGEEGVLRRLHGVRLEWHKGQDGRMSMNEIAGSEFEIDCDLCFLALGFVHPEHEGPIEQLGLEKDGRGNIKVDSNFMTSVPRIFAAGDARRGQSLVVWAISEGRQAARSVDLFLMGRSDLPEIQLI